MSAPCSARGVVAQRLVGLAARAGCSTPGRAYERSGPTPAWLCIVAAGAGAVAASAPGRSQLEDRAERNCELPIRPPVPPLQEDFKPMVTAKKGFTWRPERPNAPTFVEQKVRPGGRGSQPAGQPWGRGDVTVANWQRQCGIRAWDPAPGSHQPVASAVCPPAVGLDGAAARRLG